MRLPGFAIAPSLLPVYRPVLLRHMTNPALKDPPKGSKSVARPILQSLHLIPKDRNTAGGGSRFSHSARSHFSHSDVPGLKLATSQVAATRWSAYGTTVTCEAPPHCGAARNLASTKASSSVLVLGDLSVMVFHGALDEQFIAQKQPLEARSGFFGRKRVARSLGDSDSPSAHPRARSQQTQNDLGRPTGRRASSRRLGLGISPSRWACFRAAFRARRIASAFSRFLRSDGFS